MRKRIFLTGFLGVVFGAFLILAPASQAEQKKVFNWILHGAFAPGDAAMDSLYPFAEVVKKRSGGRLNLKVYPAEALVPAVDLVTACGKGVIQAYHSSGAYYTGTIPEGMIEASLPFLYQNCFGDLSVPNDIWYNKGLVQILREVYGEHNVYLLAFHSYSAMYAHMFNKPYEGMNSWKNVKLRSTGAFAELYKKLGSTVTYLPSSEVYMAMKLGTLDAVTYTIDGVVGLKLHEVFSHLWMPAFTDHGIGHIGVNKDAWNTLPPDLQEIFFDTAKYYLAPLTMEAYQQHWHTVVQKAPALGFKVNTIPQKDVEAIKKISMEQVWPEVAAKSSRCSKMLDIFYKYYGTQKPR